MSWIQRLTALVVELNLPEPDYGLTLPSGAELVLAYPEEQMGLVSSSAPAPEGWQLFPCDLADEASVRQALVGLGAAMGYLDPPAESAQEQVAVALDQREAGPEIPLQFRPQQLAAIQHQGGPARILAGAGTGKTTVVVGRFHWLVEQGVKPDRILVLTFSRAAARSLRDAILPGLSAAGRLWVSTFHSFCLKVLQEEMPAHVEGPKASAGLRLMQEVESRAVLEGLVAEREWSFYTGPLLSRLVNDALAFIGHAKDYLLSPNDVARYAELTDSGQLADLAEAYRSFQGELDRLEAAQFSDFIRKAVELLEEDQEVAARWQGRFDHILVDEFQDTNLAQYRVLEILARPHGNLVMVGDDDQAIYHFRGATDQFLLDPPEGTTTYKVEENFRCPQPVLDVANRLIVHNAPREEKTLVTTTKREGYPPVRSWVAETGQDEAEWVAAEIASRIHGGAPPQDFAILCRSVRRSGDAFARALTRRGIPSRLVGEEAEHPVIRQTLALLRLTRSITLPDLVEVMASKLSPQELYRAIREAAAKEPGDFGGLLSPELQAWLDARTGDSLDTLVYEALLWLGHLRLSLELSGADADRLAAARTLQERAAQATTLDDLLGMGESGPRGAAGEAVSIMTVHASKGLQFPVVFVTGLADGRFPTAVGSTPVFYAAEAIRDWLDGRGPMLPDEVERQAMHLREERRLAYVALTRAEQELFLTRAQRYGQEDMPPSRFLQEMKAPDPETASFGLSDPGAEARSYLLATASGETPPDPRELEAAFAQLAADPGTVPLRRQQAPAPFTDTQSLRLSASALETYRDCPRRYYYNYVLRLPDEGNIYLTFGSAIHDVLERYYRVLQAGRQPTTLEWEDWWQQSLDSSACEGEAQYRQLLGRGHRFLSRYFDWAEGRWAKVLAVEESFDVPYVDRRGREHRLRGRYDLIAQDQDGVTHIIDFKSGARDGVVNKRRYKNSENNPDRKLQLGIYYLTRFGGEVRPNTQVTYIFLQHKEDKLPRETVPEFDKKGEQVISCQHTEETLAGIRTRIDDAIDGILSNRFERNQSNCMFCPFQGPCEVTPDDWF